MKTIIYSLISRKYGLILIIISIACNLTCYGQELSDTSILKALFKPEIQMNDYSTYLKNSESEMTILVSLSFFFYKEFISSQSVDVCVFQPSCSEYAMEAIERKGVVRGLLDGFDRLLRCHAFVDKNDYTYNSLTMKYHDPN